MLQGWLLLQGQMPLVAGMMHVLLTKFTPPFEITLPQVTTLWLIQPSHVGPMTSKARSVRPSNKANTFKGQSLKSTNTWCSIVKSSLTGRLLNGGCVVFKVLLGDCAYCLRLLTNIHGVISSRSVFNCTICTQSELVSTKSTQCTLNVGRRQLIMLLSGKTLRACYFPCKGRKIGSHISMSC